jgi:hypothetical protein
LFRDVFVQVFRGHIGAVLGRYHHSVNAMRPAVNILDRNL